MSFKWNRNSFSSKSQWRLLSIYLFMIQKQVFIDA